MPPTRTPQDMWNFANAEGDPNGNMSYAQAKKFAEDFARANPGWTGNNNFVIDPKTGKAEDTRSWFERNGWIVPALVAVGIFVPPALATLGSGGGAGAGAATTASVAGPGVTSGLATVPGTAVGLGTGAGAATAAGVGTGAAASGGAGASGMAGAGASNFSLAPGATSAAGTTAGGNIAGGGAANFSLAPGATSAGGTTAAGNFINTSAATFPTAPIRPAPVSSGSWVSRLLGRDTLEAASRGFGAISETQASNRGTELDAMMAADEMRMRSDQDRRTSESDMWKKLQAADYMKRGGKPPSGPRRSASGQNFTQFDFGPSPISEANKQMASTLEQQLLQRLNNPPKLRDYDSKMRPGKMETATNWLGPIFDIGSKLFGRQ